jgi:hypothetical protein
MSVKVELAVDLAANGIGDYFTLDDSTKGILGGTVYKLAGDVLVDLTSYVRSVQVRRGRSRVLERFQPGIAEVVLDNRGRIFDPTYAPTSLTRTNLLTNPSPSALNTAGLERWSTTNRGTGGAGTDALVDGYLVSTVTTAASNNPYTVRIGVIGGTTQQIAVVAGTQYTMSVYVTSSVSDNRAIAIDWYNSAGSSISTTTSGVRQPLEANAETRLDVTGTAPVGATFANLAVYAGTSGPAAIVRPLDSTMKMRRALVETGSTLGSYFDGSVFGGSGLIVAQGWNGTANASTSYLTQYVAGTGSPYFGSIVPRKGVRITYSGQPLYEGLVEDWMFDFGLDGDATAVMRCVDGFASISQATVTAGTQATTGSGARVGAVLNDAGWPTLHRVISTGLATLDNDVVTANTNVATYLAKVESSEQGAFFFDKSNMATFLDRAQVQDPTSGGVEFGTSVPFVSFEAASLTDEMRNSVAVTYTAGTVVAGTATASSSSSITAYGQIDYSLDTLVSTNLQAQAIADFLVNQYSEPRFRVDGLTVIVDALSPTQALSVIDLELADIVTVAVSLPNINSVGSALSRTVAIDEISHSIDIDRHLISFRTSDAITGFVLDSSDFGVLDINQLGF